MRALARSLAAAALVLAACGGEGEAPQKAVTPLDRSVVGTITGTVTFQGTPPPMQELHLDAACASRHQGPVLTGDALVHDGKVENVFVWVKDGLGDRVFATPTEPVTIDQRGCLYEPHVAGAQTGQPILYVNSDPVMHNVHATSNSAGGWNFATATAGSRNTVRVVKPQVMVDVRCDIHPWMRSYLGAVDHPYFAVTGADGRFTLRDLPPGDYVVGAWHERFGTREARVTLGAKETKTVDVAYTAR